MAAPTSGRSSGSRITKRKSVWVNYTAPSEVDYDREPYVKHKPSESNIGNQVPVDDEEYIGVKDGRPHLPPA